MKIRLFLIYVALMIVGTLCAGNVNYSVYGYARDASGNLLDHVEVRDLVSNFSMLTDSTGYYRVSSDKDSIILQFSHIGYKAQRYTFVKKGRISEHRHDFQMIEQAQELNDILVQGAHLQVTTFEDLDYSVLSAIPNAGGDNIEAIIKTLQGVSSNNELTSQYSVRGGNYDENSVYVNGIEVYRPYLIRTGEQEGLSFVNPDMVGSLSFSAGGFDARYGDKLSSVLEITYRQPRMFEAGIGVSLMGASAYIGSRNGKFSQLHGIRYKNSSLILGHLQTNADYDPNFVDYQTYMTYDVNDKVQLFLMGNVSQNTYNFTPISRETSFGPSTMIKNFKVYFSGQEQDRFLTAFGAFGVRYKPNDQWKFSWNVSGFYTDERVNYDIQGEYWLSDVASLDEEASETCGVGNYYEHARNQMNAGVIRFSHDGECHWSENNTLAWGVDILQEIVDEKVNEWEMRDSSGYSMPFNGKDVNLYYSLVSENRMNETRAHMYIQDEYRLHLDKGGLMIFTGGLRLNGWSFNKEIRVSPRMTIAYFPDIKPDMRFRLSTGLYYQSPSFKEVKDTVTVNGNLTNYLNKDIVSQQAFQLIAGMDYYYNWMRHPFKLSVDVYYKNLKNIITYNQDNLTIRYLGKNNARGYVAGLDMKLFGEFVPGCDSWISFSLMRAMEDVEGDRYGFIPRPTDQLYNISVFFQDYIPGLPQYRVHLLFNWAQGLPVGPPRSERYMSSTMRTPDYRRVDIGFSRVCEKGKDAWMGRGFFKPFKRIVFAIECLNLFGFKNVSSYYWITDIYSQQYAVPNYLTGRQFNFKINIDF